MQTLIGRQAQAPGATFTHAQAVQSSQAFRNTHSPLKKRRKRKWRPCSEKSPRTMPRCRKSAPWLRSTSDGCKGYVDSADRRDRDRCPGSRAPDCRACGLAALGRSSSVLTVHATYSTGQTGRATSLRQDHRRPYRHDRHPCGRPYPPPPPPPTWALSTTTTTTTTTTGRRPYHHHHRRDDPARKRLPRGRALTPL